MITKVIGKCLDNYDGNELLPWITVADTKQHANNETPSMCSLMWFKATFLVLGIGEIKYFKKP